MTAVIEHPGPRPEPPPDLLDVDAKASMNGQPGGGGLVQDRPGQLMPGQNAPSRWSWAHLDADAAAQLWAELVDFVCWLDDRYLRHQAGPHLRLKACWYRHPVAVEELTALLAAWQAVYCPPGEDPETEPVSNSPTGALVRWHDLLWTTLQRLRDFAGWNECEPATGHRERDGRYDPDLRIGLDEFLADDLAGRPEPVTVTAPANAASDAAPANRDAPDDGQDEQPTAEEVAPLLLQGDVEGLLGQGLAVQLLPGEPASPLHVDGGWWACPAPDGETLVWAPILDDDVAAALDEHYRLTHGHDVADGTSTTADTGLRADASQEDQ